MVYTHTHTHTLPYTSLAHAHRGIIILTTNKKDTKAAFLDFLVTRDLYEVSVEAVVGVVTLVTKGNLLQSKPFLRVEISEVMD